MQVTGKSVPSGEGRQCKGPGVSPAGPPGGQSGWFRVSNREVMWGWGRGDNLLRHWEDSAFTLSEMRKHWGLWSREVR